MFVMVDMDVGNLGSVIEAFTRVQAPVKIAESRSEIENADVVILPGVGAFADAMDNLRSRGLVEIIRRHALIERRPLLGICVGMQILADRGEEHGASEGLGLSPGSVVKLVPPNSAYRVPHMGWSDVSIERQGVLFPESSAPRAFYFAHSYHLICDDVSHRAASVEYGGRVTAAVERDNICGVQFHPEKSQDAGLDALSAFALWALRGGQR